MTIISHIFKKNNFLPLFFYSDTAIVSNFTIYSRNIKQFFAFHPFNIATKRSTTIP